MEYYPPTTSRLKVLKESGIYPFSNDLQIFAKSCALLFGIFLCFCFLKPKLVEFYDLETNNFFLAAEVFKNVAFTIAIFLGTYLSVVILFSLVQRGFVLVISKNSQNIHPHRLSGEDVFRLFFAVVKGCCLAGLVVVSYLLVFVEQSADFYRLIPMEYGFGSSPNSFEAEFTRIVGIYLTAFGYIVLYALVVMGLVAIISRYCVKYLFNYRYRMTKSEIEVEMRDGEIPQDVRAAIKSQQDEYRKNE